MNGSRLAILGLGRSGVSAAKAARAAGYEVVAVDEKPASEPAIAKAIEELEALGIDAKAGWRRGSWETGAQTLVTSPGVPKDHDLLQEAVRTGIEVISEIELAYRLTDDPIVGITGTNGKSTTTVMTWLCAKAAGFDAVLCGNIYGSGYEEVPLTEAATAPSPFSRSEKGEGVGGEGSHAQISTDPHPPAPSPFSGEKGERERRALIAEISSFQLEWVRRFRPAAATITNITPDHLNRYADFREYAKTKQRIFERIGNDDVAVWHDGDFLTEPPQGVSTLAYGEGAKHAWVDARRMHLMDACVDLEELPFSEPHNHLNAMAAGLLAAGLAQSQGGEADPEKLLEALKSFKGLAHRMERLGQRDGIEAINNSMCTNPAAVISSSRSLKQKQRLLIGGVNKGLDFTPVGDYLLASGHAAYLFGRDGSSIGAQLGGGFPVFKTMAEAFAAAASDAQPGEIVMLAPGVASMDQFADFRERGEAFRKMAKEWLGGGLKSVDRGAE